MMVLLYKKDPSPNDYKKAGMGYGLSRAHREEYAYRYDRQETITHNVLLKVQERIEWAETSYEKALADYKGNIKIYTDLTLNWSPQRVLTTYKYFAKLCAYLNDERVWKQLSRSQRKFISRAYELFVDRRR